MMNIFIILKDKMHISDAVKSYASARYVVILKKRAVPITLTKITYVEVNGEYLYNCSVFHLQYMGYSTLHYKIDFMLMILPNYKPV